MRLWLDMANSPHPVLFAAMAAEFEERGWDVLVTTRDHGQTKDLTLKIWPDAAIVGRESPAGRGAKLMSVARRSVELALRARRNDVDVAVSLNSYAQVVSAALLRIPSVTLMDYEYQPANHLSFRLATKIAVPKAFPSKRLRHYGASARRVERFDGYKEEFYLDRFTAEPEIGPGRDRRSRVVFRPPAEGALYHAGANVDFDHLVAFAGQRSDLAVTVLPRLEHQRTRYAAIPGVAVPPRTIDGLAALRAADVFVGAGGTMSREAALLGVRAYTVFAGRRPAVDEALIEAGRLRELKVIDPTQIDWSRRPLDAIAADLASLKRRATSCRAWFADVIASVR